MDKLPDWVVDRINHPDVVEASKSVGTHVLPLLRNRIEIYRPTVECGFRSVGLWWGETCVGFDIVHDEEGSKC